MASASASPSSPSSAVSTPQQQQQLQQRRQPLQQQFLRRSEGNEALLAHHVGNVHGGANFASASGSMQIPQQSRKFIDSGQHHASLNIPEQALNRSQGSEQQMLNPIQQAYLHYAFQAAQQKPTVELQSHHQMKPGMFGTIGKDRDIRMANIKMQELMSLHTANNSQPSSSKISSEQSCQGEIADNVKQPISGQRTESKPSHQPTLLGQVVPTASMQGGPQSQQNIMNMTNNPIAAQVQAMQALALERNIDLSNPASANMMAQLIPLMQAQMAAQQKANESNAGVHSASMPKQQVPTTKVANESSPRGNSSGDVSGRFGYSNARQIVGSDPPGVTSSATIVNSSGNNPIQQFSVHGRDNHLPPRHPTLTGKPRPPTNPLQSSVNLSQGVDSSLLAKNSVSGPEVLQVQHARQLNQSSLHCAASSNDGGVVNSSTSQGGPRPQTCQQHIGFTKQQLHVLKAQILAFRRLKKGDGTLPRELLQAVAPPPLELQIQQVFPPSGTVSKDRSAGENLDGHARHVESSEKGHQVVTSSGGLYDSKEEVSVGDRFAVSTVNMRGIPVATKELGLGVAPGKEGQQTVEGLGKSDQEAEPGIQKTPDRNDISADKCVEVATQTAVSDAIQDKKPVQAGNMNQPKDAGSTRMYHGPLFDFPVFTRKHDTFGSSMMNNSNNLTLSYDVKDLFKEEEIWKRKSAEKIEKIDKILAVNLERKRIRPDLVIRLQIESKKLQLAERQVRLRDVIEQQQLEIMAMPDRPYRKFVRLCERQRQELNRHSKANQKATREKQLKSIFQWRKKLLEAHWAIRDARTARNRGVHKYHERILREFSKRKDDGRNKRMEALKNNDVERYREMLLEQHTNIPGEAAERYAVLSSFLTQTEEYLQKLGSKITAAKNQQEVEEAANAAAVAARAQGLSEEEVRAAAACAREEVMIRNRFSEMNAPKDNASVNK